MEITAAFIYVLIDHLNVLIRLWRPVRASFSTIDSDTVSREKGYLFIYSLFGKNNQDL